MEAIEAKNTRRVRKLLAKGVDVNARDLIGQTALMYASRLGLRKILNLLYEHGADINLKDRYDGTALFAALLSGYEYLRGWFLERGAKHSLFTAIYTGDWEAFQETLLTVKDINRQYPYRGTYLHDAVRLGRVEMVKGLLSTGGIDVNLKSIDGLSALSIAAFEGQQEMLDLLYEHGADINIRDRDGETALLTAFSQGHRHLLDWFLERGVKHSLATAIYAGDWEAFQRILPTVRDINARIDLLTPLQYAAQEGQEKMVEVLLSLGAEKESMGGWFFSPLTLAVQGEHLATVQTLLAHGADPNSCGQLGTALTCAAIRGNAQIVRLLLESGADPNLPGEADWTAVEEASLEGYTEVVKELMCFGANPYLQDDDGQDAFYVNNSENAEEIEQYLLTYQPGKGEAQRS